MTKTALRSALVFLILLLSVEAIAYETCDSTNDYLQAQLPTWRGPESDHEFPLDCIETAQLLLPVTGYYGYCPTPDGRPTRNHPRPCISENYVGAVHSAIRDVSQCLGFDERWAFSVFNLESSMHLNAVGGTADAGLGQLTTIAIEEVNLNALEKAHAKAKRKGSVACRRVLKGMVHAESDTMHRCSFINLPNNPIQNAAFSLILTMHNRDLLDGALARLGVHFPKRVHRERVKTLISFLAYNAGVNGLAATLKAYIDLNGEALSDDDFNFENRTAGSFATFMEKNYPAKDEAMRSRISKYIGYMIKGARKVESTLMMPGHCTDPNLFQTDVTNGPKISTVPEADRTRAQGLIEQNIETLTDSLVKVHAISKADCEARRTQFLYSFTSRGEEFRDLSPRLQQKYKEICADN